MFLVCSGLGKSMLVFFLVFGKISYFPCGKIFSFFSSYFLGLFKGLLSLHSSDYRLVKIESLSFSLVLSRTFELIGFFCGVHPQLIVASSFHRLIN